MKQIRIKSNDKCFIWFAAVLVQYCYFNYIINMSIMSNNRILGWISIQQFHLKIIVATVLFSLGLLYLSKKFGIFHNVEFTNERFPRSRIIYFNHRGAYENLGPAFDKIAKDCSKYFKFCKTFGIYYDDPNSLEDKSSCRSTIGAIINQGELFKLQDFLRDYKSYQTTVLPASTCVSTYHPYANVLSFFIIVSKVYPKLQQYLKKKQLYSSMIIMEIYHFISDRDRQIQISAILDNFQSFNLWEDLNQLKEERIKH